MPPTDVDLSQRREIKRNVELAFVPFYASWLNREARLQVLRCFALDGTDHVSHEAHARLIRRYIAWRNRTAQDKALREM
ncbi:MAG: hypothetical protein LC792_16675 [Actinobacteria bacterium]|nr:hypothetical protein [Actinomycetota bacterium]